METELAERSTIRNCSIDWVTATLPGRASPFAHLAWAEMLESLEAPNPTKPDPKPWAWMGYVGMRRPGTAWGSRQDGSIIQASGRDAAVTFWQLPQTQVHYSRLDLQVTFWPDPPEADLAAWACDRALQAREKTASSRRRRVTLICGNGDGDTLYIGSRKSEQYGRLYDKGAESHAEYYKGAWRAEVEYKNEAATQIAKKIRESANPTGSIHATVASWYRERGADLLPDGQGQPLRFVVAPRVKPDDLHKLQWLATCVSPVVDRLVKAVGFAQVNGCLYNGDEYLRSVGVLEDSPRISGTQHERSA